MSPRKNLEAQLKEKKDKKQKKVLDLEEEEYQGVEEVEAKGIELIYRLPEYIPLRKGKTKATKDPDSGKFVVSTPLLSEHVTFEGPRLVCIIVLKMGDRDLVYHEIFLHLMTHKYMTKIYYDEIGVTQLEPMKWVRGVKQSVCSSSSRWCTMRFCGLHNQ